MMATHEVPTSPFKSLQTRILLAISASVLLMLASTALYGVTKMRHMSELQVRHEGLLLSNALEAAIVGLKTPSGVLRAQEYIDALVLRRKRNDIEINLMLLERDASRIVASNAPTNIEEADEEEHIELLKVIASGESSLVFDSVDPFEDAEDFDSHTDPTHPDFHFPEGSRFLSITSPLLRDDGTQGSINIIQSLHYLDRELAGLTHGALTAIGLGCLILAGVLTPFLKRTVFRPLNALAHDMHAFGMGQDISLLTPAPRDDEIGVLSNEFHNMVARIKSAEAMKEELARARAEKKERELETQLRQSQKMEALGTLAGGIAHDFNNMLTPIIGYTELSLAKLPPDGNVQEDLGQVIGAAQRAQDLVRQILTFSRQTEEELSPISPARIVLETMKFLRASIPSSIDVRQNIEALDTKVMGRATHIHQVVLNLATNAYQAMRDGGGVITVILSEQQISMADSTQLPEGSYLRLSVADSGPGIPANVLDRIFDPYFTTKSEGEGTGLGLATVHGIVHDMGGDVLVRSHPGKGTTLDVYLPVCHDSEISPEVHDDEVVPHGTEHVVVLDDEPAIAAMVGEMLASAGYTPETFVVPSEALRYVSDMDHPVDLFISDIAMPEMTGIELIRRLPKTRALPVILCSAYPGGMNLDASRDLGVHAVLTKPILRQQLARVVRNVLDEAQMA